MITICDEPLETYAHLVSSVLEFGRRLAGVQSQQRVQQDRLVRHAVDREAVQMPLGIGLGLRRRAAVLHVDAPERRSHRGRPHEDVQGEITAHPRPVPPYTKALFGSVRFVLSLRHQTSRTLCLN